MLSCPAVAQWSAVPEGDTVYLTAKRLHAALAGELLLRGELRHPRLVQHNLSGRTVTDVRSVGKHLFARFDDDTSLHSHLRMDGAWHLYPPGQRWRRPAHQARVILTTARRVVVGFALHDLQLLPTDDEQHLIGHLGPDLLDPGWGGRHAELATARLVEQHDTELGLVLLDQRVIAGIGNLYKNEMCFLLGVSPLSTVGAVSAPTVVALARKLLLRNADRPEQSTTGDLTPGRQHWVYERGGKPCRRCGERIQRVMQGDGIYARSTYFCPRCQRLR